MTSERKEGGGAGEPDLLASCYRSALDLAREEQVRAIAFPAISCGVFGYPVPRAAAVAVDAISAYLIADRLLERV